MEIDEKKRILFVEDKKPFREAIVEEIYETIKDVEIDEVATSDGALKMINQKTYHAAILDIMLSDDINHRGGIKVLDEIKSLNEGTLAVMLSGTLDIHCAIHAIRSRIVIDYVHKNEINEDINIIIDPLKKALNEAHIPVYGKYGRLTSFLCAPTDPNTWEFEAMQAIGGGGFDTLNRSLAAIFRNISPVLPLKEIDVSMKADGNKKAIYGAFWSKVLGHAIWVCLWPTKGSAVKHPSCEGEEKKIETDFDNNACIWKLNLNREAFAESLWEV